MEAVMTPAKDPTGDPTLVPTRFIDSDHPAVRDFAFDTIGSLTDTRERAVTLYYRVRDAIRYQPYRISLAPEEMTASATLQRGEAFCVPKAILLAAVGRAVGIPTRLGFADVKNHLATGKLLDALGTDLFIYHGYTELLIEGQWVKATPAFNIELCEKFGVLPLDFDGTADSVFHPYDAAGRQHMEYVRDHGTFDDLPLERITREYRATYPTWSQTIAGDFGDDGAREREAS
jgi:transglutaminase-like putative cysteine protease